MKKQELIKKIISKKEFSQLPVKDVELVFEKFNKDKYSDEEKIKFSRDLLKKVYTVFVSSKLLNLKDRSEEWFLKKHISTRERFDCYEELYERLLKDLTGEINIFDLGAGVNGFSYNYFKKKVKYFGIEAVGQLVNLMNYYFKKNNFSATAIHQSLFELDKIKSIIKKEDGVKVIFLFKVLDSLEMLERDYSKVLLRELVPLVDKIVVSFATKSLVSRKAFKVKRNWIVNFIKQNFEILDDFELCNERYIVFKKQSL